jgi:hypothetical protein
MCRARFNRRSPPRLIRWRTVFPDEAGIGFTPARLANAASDRTPSGMGPCGERDCRGDRSDAGLVKELARGAGVEECGHLLGV